MLKGYRCELEGMGIGAAIYYRRVVEVSHKAIVGSILKLAKEAGNDPEIVKSLEEAAKERSFTRSVENVSLLIPPALYIGGVNPLLTLHGLLSIAVHALPDDECMAHAKLIRELLAHIASEVPRLLEQSHKLGETLTNAEKAIQAARAASIIAQDGNVS